jgi:DNA-binding transcriptional regulator YdaS (Cro superfamily)
MVMADSVSPHEAFRNAVRIAGGQAPLARIAGCTQGAVWQRLKAGKSISGTWVLKVEAATGVSKHDLRPDLYPRLATDADSTMEPAR